MAIKRCSNFVGNLPCGRLNPNGVIALCETCQQEAMDSFPQGWLVTPGDLCEHGVHLYPLDGRDAICGLCE